MAPYASLAEWRSNLEKDFFGEIWAAKFAFDLAGENLLRSIEAIFYSVVEENLDQVDDSNTALSIVQSVVERRAEDLLLQGRRFALAPELYSLIVRVEVFTDYYLTPELSTRIDEGPIGANFVWQNLGTTISRLFYDGTVRTDLPLFWCTPTAGLEKIIRKYRANQAATVIRTRLGLLQMKKGQRLIRVDIPLTAVAGKNLRAPTTLDARINPAFVPSASPDGYGRTLNLKKCERDLKELVCEAIPFTSSFNAIKIGTVGARCPTVDWNTVRRLV